MVRQVGVTAVRPAQGESLQDEAVRLYLTLGRIARTLRHDNPSPVGAGALGALSTVVRLGPLRAGELAQHEGVSAPSISRMVAVLEAHGAVRRTVDPQDSRAALIEATQTGRQLLQSGRSDRIGALRQRIEALSGPDRGRISAALPALEALAACD